MFETVERKLSLRESTGKLLGLSGPIPRWEIPLRLLGLVLAAIVIFGAGRAAILESPAGVSAGLLASMAVSVGIGIGLHVKHSLRRDGAVRKR